MTTINTIEIMSADSDISKFSKEQLIKEQSNTDLYNTILIVSIAITLIATLLLNHHNNRLTHLKDLQLQQVEKSQSDNSLHIASLNDSVAKANERTANTSLELEKQKKENIRLYELLLPRYVDIDKFSNNLLKYKGSKVEIRSTTDGESSNLKEQLIIAFRKAEWIVNFITVQAYKHQFDGLEIAANPEMFSVNENLVLVPKMEAIYKELFEQKIESYLAKSQDEHQRDYIIINIGYKGNPHLIKTNEKTTNTQTQKGQRP